MATTVTLSLISHTNVGKTTLARTLLRRDVGEVLDQAHVTEVSEAHGLIEAGGDVLELWDTPGFGDTARLMRRLRRENNPIGWFLHQVWDRVVHRPLWCSQEAARNIKEEADVVLYLVNASEEPEDAGYVALELELLTWMNRPALLLLNQVGESEAGLESRWRSFVESWPVVRDVLSLDAFTRCWAEEGILLQRIVHVLDGEKRGAMEALSAAWSQRNLAVFRSSCELMAVYLARAALDRETPGAGTGTQAHASDMGGLGALKDALKFGVIDKKRSMAALNERLDRSTQELMGRMISEHGLTGRSAARIEQRVQDFQVKAAIPINERSGALAGAVVSGALTGLAADALAGGLSLGGGMIAGGILGALGGAALGRGYRMVSGQAEPFVKWSPQLLDQLCRQVLLRYLAVAHFGRGRGDYQDLEQPDHWSSAVGEALRAHQTALQEVWKVAERDDLRVSDRVHTELRRIIDDAARAVLREAYPHAGELLA